jgi:hypothetical protein
VVGARFLLDDRERRSFLFRVFRRADVRGDWPSPRFVVEPGAWNFGRVVKAFTLEPEWRGERDGIETAWLILDAVYNYKAIAGYMTKAEAEKVAARMEAEWLVEDACEERGLDYEAAIKRAWAMTRGGHGYHAVRPKFVQSLGLVLRDIEEREDVAASLRL